MSIQMIELWHKHARPEPSDDDFNVQLGCHIEEFAEMLDTLYPATSEGLAQYFRDFRETVHRIAMTVKNGTIQLRVDDRKEFLDSIADQIVTGVGAAYCADMRITAAVDEVNKSNWSKFDDNGQPIRDANGKIKKGHRYVAPNLDGLY